MKFIVSILLTAFLAYVICLFLPWWGFAISSFIVAFVIQQQGWKSFVSGFTALFIFWGVYAFMLDTNNAHLLSAKVAHILPMDGSYILLIILTAFIGGIVSGFAALTGSFTRRIYE